MQRRDVLKVLGAAPAAAFLPAAALTATAAAQAAPATAAAPAAYQPRALDAHEYRLLTVISDLILPADERTGSATDCGVPACVDDFLTIRGELLLDQIRGGFLWLDRETRRQHKVDFADATKAQQTALMDRIAWPGRAALEDQNAAAFFNHLRDLVVNAFYSSQMGVQDLQYQGNTMVMDWVGCPAPVLTKLDTSYAAAQWRLPFPRTGA
ncbi:MAG TPA: gluconate 2-dehydrogenase subunit 3 family protein [Terriglobales bacterium]|jgi:hypothetical protein